VNVGKGKGEGNNGTKKKSCRGKKTGRATIRQENGGGTEPSRKAKKKKMRGSRKEGRKTVFQHRRRKDV